MLIRCPECGEQISDQVEMCPKCGIPNPAGRVALSQQERKGHRRRKLLRAVAVVLAVLIFATGGTALYLWRFSVQHDIVRYVIGPVTGTSKISQQHFANVVRGVVEEWNNASGKTMLWRLPFGRLAWISLATDQAVKDYLAAVTNFRSEADYAKLSADAADAVARSWENDHPDSFYNESSPFHAKMAELASSWYAANEEWRSLLKQVATAESAYLLKDNHIRGLETTLTSSSAPIASIAITSYISDANLRALLSHAVGHVLGLVHSSADDVMSATGRSTTITKDLAAEAAAGH